MVWTKACSVASGAVVFGLCDMGIGTMCSVDGALVVTGAETCERGVFGAPHLSWEHGLREESPIVPVK
jgi:hypothetical protein